jgi:hypothetical protein
VSEQSQDSRQKLEINPVQVTASALAAVTSAVCLSTLGTAGTIIGAALGSLFATAGAALYSYSIRVGRERAARLQAAAIAKVNRRSVGGSTRQIDVLDEAEEDSRRPAWREALTRLPWKWIAMAAGAVFVITMIVILSFELLTGRSVSTYTHGSDGNGHHTSLGFGSSSKASQSPTPTPTPSSSSTPDQGSSSEAPTSSRPSPEVKSTPTTEPSSSPSASLPTGTPSSSPSSSPSD